MSVQVVPFGQTPGYLDPRSQETLHEVDVSPLATLLSFDHAPEGVRPFIPS